MVGSAGRRQLWPRACAHCSRFLVNLVLMDLIVLASSIHDSVPPPKFLPGPSDVTVRQGDVAILPCAVKHLGTKQVAWRRTDGDDFLTIGEMTWIGDDNIAVEHTSGDPETGHWNLVIDKVTPDDAGEYECQVTSKLGFHKLVNLKVVGPPISEPVISIEGKRYVNLDDKIHLICNASGGSRIPEDIDWFKEGDMIDPFKFPHVLIDTYPSLKNRALISELEIERARSKDSGEYVCRSSRNNIVNMKVTVLTAVKQNNMKRGTDGDPDSPGGSACSIFPASRSAVHVLLVTLVTQLLLPVFFLHLRPAPLLLLLLLLLLRS